MVTGDRFASIAQAYEQWSTIDPAYQELHARVIELLKKESSKDPGDVLEVFEIGFGTGITSEAILKADKGFRLKGVDVSPEMSDIATKKLRPYSHRIELFTGDALKVLPKIGQQRCIVSVCTMHNIPARDRLKVYQLIYQKLKPGGIFINGDKVAVNDPVLYLEMWDRWIQSLDGFQDQNQRQFWRDHELSDHINRYSEQELFLTLNNIGFTQVVAVDRINMYLITVARKGLG